MAGQLALTGVGGGGATVLLLDHFTDADGTALNSHVMDVGAGWTVRAGAVTIQSNKYDASTGTGQATADAGSANVTIAATINLRVNGAGGLLGRYFDNANFWLLELDAAASTYRLDEVNAGSFTVRASAAQTVTSGTDYALSLTVTTSGGNTVLHATVNGGNPLDYSGVSSIGNNTNHGIRIVGGATGGTADDFQVTSP